MLPEVVLFAKAENVIGRNTDLLVPDLKGLIIILVDGRIQSGFFQTNNLGQEFPAPCDCFLLKVVTEGEIAQHFEISAVAGGLTDVLNVAGTDALLAGAYTAAGRLHLTGKVGLHGCHAGVDQQQRGIVLGNQGKAGQAQMILALKELQKHLAQLIYAIGFHTHWNLTSIIDYTRRSKIKRPYLPIGAKNRGTTLIHPQCGHLSCSVTGAPVPVIPGNAGNGLQVIRRGLSPLPSRFGRVPCLVS